MNSKLLKEYVRELVLSELHFINPNSFYGSMLRKSARDIKDSFADALLSFVAKKTGEPVSVSSRRLDDKELSSWLEKMKKAKKTPDEEKEFKRIESMLQSRVER